MMTGMGGGVGSAVTNLQALHDELLQQRSALDGQIEAVASALRAIGRPVAAGARMSAFRPMFMRGGRGRGGGGNWRPGSLKAHIADVLRGGGEMAVKDITAGVVRGGYKSKNKTLSKSVGIALTEMQGVNKTGRGRFRMG